MMVSLEKRREDTRRRRHRQMPKWPFRRGHLACVAEGFMRAFGVAETRCMSARMSKAFARLCRQNASTVTEYAVIAAIVSIAGVLLLTAIGHRTNGLLDQMNSNFPR
jgi:Flp pilus assembly pilin Flp